MRAMVSLGQAGPLRGKGIDLTERYRGGFHFIPNTASPKLMVKWGLTTLKAFWTSDTVKVNVSSTVNSLFRGCRALGRRGLTKDGENDHEEEQQQEDVHEGRQGLEDLPQVAGERAGQEGVKRVALSGTPRASWGPGAPDSHNTKSCCISVFPEDLHAGGEREDRGQVWHTQPLPLLVAPADKGPVTNGGKGRRPSARPSAQGFPERDVGCMKTFRGHLLPGRLLPAL